MEDRDNVEMVEVRKFSRIYVVNWITWANLNVLFLMIIKLNVWMTPTSPEKYEIKTKMLYFL